MARYQCFRAEGDPIRWRLLSGNNRVLGLSDREQEDHEDVLHEVEIVRKLAIHAELFVFEHRADGLWWWRMELPDPRGDAAPRAALATSSRGFARRVDALRSVQRFRENAPDAEPDMTLVVFQTGRRSREIHLEQPPPRDMPPQRPVG